MPIRTGQGRPAKGGPSSIAELTENELASLVFEPVFHQTDPAHATEATDLVDTTSNNGAANGQRPTTIPVLSVFCGAGGMDLGFERAGFEPLLALDVNQTAVDTYNWNRHRRRNPARVADLAETSPDTILEWWKERAGRSVRPCGIIGGPPCQAFSMGNVHRIANDPRAQLPLAYAKILRKFNEAFGLDFFVFENSAGLGYEAHQGSLQRFINAFRRAGFSIHVFYLDAARFGVPQQRKRMFILGFNGKQLKGLRYEPPGGDDEVLSVEQAIGHLPDAMRFSSGRRPVELGLHPNHWCMNPKSRKFRDGTLQPGEMPGRSFRVLRWDEPSWTVAYGNREVHIHPAAQRRLSVYEAMWLQGLAPIYELRGTLTDQIRLVSDAVPPPLAYALATSILDALETYRAALAAKQQPSRNGH